LLLLLSVVRHHLHTYYVHTPALSAEVLPHDQLKAKVQPDMCEASHLDGVVDVCMQVLPLRADMRMLLSYPDRI
jgi:hypothetical protein